MTPHADEAAQCDEMGIIARLYVVTTWGLLYHHIDGIFCYTTENYKNNGNLTIQKLNYCTICKNRYACVQLVV